MSNLPWQQLPLQLVSSTQKGVINTKEKGGNKAALRLKDQDAHGLAVGGYEYVFVFLILMIKKE